MCSDRLLLRRLGAGVIDLGLVVAAGLSAVISVNDRLVLNRSPDGGKKLSIADQQRISDFGGVLGRAYEFDDHLMVFSTGAMLMIWVTVVVAGLILGVLIPILTDGQSAGKKLFRLRVVGIDGSSPALTRYVIRTTAGLADLMPLVVPGLAGFAFAASNPSNQRIGDRAAQTIVVDTRQHCLLGAASHPAKAQTTSSNNKQPPDRNPKLNTWPQRPDQLEDGGKSPSVPGQTNADTTGRPHRGLGRDERYGDRIDMSDSVNAGHSQTSSNPHGARRVPVEERPTNPYPKPIRPERDESMLSQVGSESNNNDDEITPDGYDSLALPESSLSDMPLTNSVLFEALGLSPEAIAQLESDLAEPGPRSKRSETPDMYDTDATPQDFTPFLPPTTNFEVSPDKEPDAVPEALRPRAQPTDIAPEIASAPQHMAPMDGSLRATATNLSPPPPVSRSVASVQSAVQPVRQIQEIQPRTEPSVQHEPAQPQPQPVSQVQPDPGPESPTVPEQTPLQQTAVHRPLQEWAGPELAPVQETPIAQQTPRQAATTQIVEPRVGSTPAADQRAPIWSEDWEAWIYWDTTLRCWFRHDDVSGNWVPMEG